MGDAIDAWLRELRHALNSERRLRGMRILDEARDHLHSSSDVLEKRGMSRHEADVRAVAQFGEPAGFARDFSPPVRRDWLVDTTAWLSSRIAASLIALGALMLLIETLAWSIGTGPVSAQTVRVWQTCRHSINGECVGGWRYANAPSLLLVGAVCLAAGVIALTMHGLLRRRYSDLELMPRLLDVGTEISLATLGLVLLVGGTTRSSLDATWRWVPVWLPVGLACVGATVLLRRSDMRRRRRTEDMHLPLLSR
jgi:hypothetical protein